MAKKVKGKWTVDDQLTNYLDVAEDALIGAIKLFSEHPKLQRRVGYLTRLARAQELITGLHREELVRKRGPMNRKRR
jgi:hypothetical protein